MSGEFATDRIRPTHLSDKLANVRVDLRAAAVPAEMSLSKAMRLDLAP